MKTYKQSESYLLKKLQLISDSGWYIKVNGTILSSLAAARCEKTGRIDILPHFDRANNRVEMNYESTLRRHSHPKGNLNRLIQGEDSMMLSIIYDSQKRYTHGNVRATTYRIIVNPEHEQFMTDFIKRRGFRFNYNVRERLYTPEGISV